MLLLLLLDWFVICFEKADSPCDSVKRLEILNCVFLQVTEQRHAESQALLQDESRAPSEQGSSVHHGEPSRRPGRAPHEAAAFNLNLSFEELSGAGLEEPPRHSGNSHWLVRLRVCSLVCHNSRYDYTLFCSVQTHSGHTCTCANEIRNVKVAGILADVHNATLTQGITR